MADRLTRITTPLAVAAGAVVAAVISYRHAYELVTTHGETGLTARLLPFTVDGLILAASMLILDASRRHHPATIGALVPGRRHRRHHRRQPGPRPGPRTYRRTGQRLARPGPGRLRRTPHDPHRDRATHRDDSHPHVSRRPGCADRGARCATRANWHASGGADGTGPAQRRPQPARQSANSASTAARSNASSTTPAGMTG